MSETTETRKVPIVLPVVYQHMTALLIEETVEARVEHVMQSVRAVRDLLVALDEANKTIALLEERLAECGGEVAK